MVNFWTEISMQYTKSPMHFLGASLKILKWTNGKTYNNNWQEMALQ